MNASAVMVNNIKLPVKINVTRLVPVIQKPVPIHPEGGHVHFYNDQEHYLWDMWTCPKCQHKFWNKNQSHSCGAYTVEDFLEGKSEVSKELFRYFIEQYRKIGEFELHPVKTRVALLTKMRFASINKIGKDHIDAHLVFTEPFEHTLCFHKIDKFDRFYVHYFKLHHKDDITEELTGYMRKAYDTGLRKHVK
jgi:hypothetical protein